MKRRAYLDIETTGLSRRGCEITVVGIATENAGAISVAQQVEVITAGWILDRLGGCDELYTYNGSRFDLPFVREKVGLDLRGVIRHTDLMYKCWKHELKGGLKAVERKLGIGRELSGVDGYMAVVLWWRYKRHNDRAALETLLEYNAEDIVNLDVLRRKLGVD